MKVCVKNEQLRVKAVCRFCHRWNTELEYCSATKLTYHSIASSSLKLVVQIEQQQNTFSSSQLFTVGRLFQRFQMWNTLSLVPRLELASNEREFLLTLAPQDSRAWRPKPVRELLKITMQCALLPVRKGADHFEGTWDLMAVAALLRDVWLKHVLQCLSRCCPLSFLPRFYEKVSGAMLYSRPVSSSIAQLLSRSERTEAGEWDEDSVNEVLYSNCVRTYMRRSHRKEFPNELVETNNEPPSSTSIIVGSDDEATAVSYAETSIACKLPPSSPPIPASDEVFPQDIICEDVEEAADADESMLGSLPYQQTSETILSTDANAYEEMLLEQT